VKAIWKKMTRAKTLHFADGSQSGSWRLMRLHEPDWEPSAKWRVFALVIFFQIDFAYWAAKTDWSSIPISIGLLAHCGCKSLLEEIQEHFIRNTLFIGPLRPTFFSFFFYPSSLFGN
jgi:hypothetical protein